MRFLQAVLMGIALIAVSAAGHAQSINNGSPSAGLGSLHWTCDDGVGSGDSDGYGCRCTAGMDCHRMSTAGVCTVGGEDRTQCDASACWCDLGTRYLEDADTQGASANDEVAPGSIEPIRRDIRSRRGSDRATSSIEEDADTEQEPVRRDHR